jgi:hypothetical protein
MDVALAQLIGAVHALLAPYDHAYRSRTCFTSVALNNSSSWCVMLADILMMLQVLHVVLAAAHLTSNAGNSSTAIALAAATTTAQC